ncbi:pyridine nucleotide-disulfide oxidoreductase/dicluster-binding protein [Desulfoscipio gibsoniae]|uniref:NADPH-dependent glutamate synthase beta chain-like oxidoreductase n=1 Tax=Desulfoscipio gibsoniae DSM 7213 TaxID=767817 RepID=R4KDV3_9FIRM|nr:pyridine nucleotide-disulfide oxidoreductase/dicluster-binding protein [Desulfoscipio gibsoniae]AGK99856.1 NADPH-dependent glutamate synthase beta chain-like oxidoreductase [Desulfoscipio gibsoniae DSM 7213]
MDQKRIIEFEEKCTQEHPPACMTACPVHVDVRSFVAEIKAGNFDQAWQIFSKTVRFPGIIGRVCDHPCQAACKRQEAGDAISIAALEKACVEMNSAPPVKLTISSKKDKRVAVVGGGLSGLGAAVDLAGKGYSIVIFEATDRLGGRLWEIPAEVLPRQIIQEDTAVLDSLDVEIQFNTTVGQTLSIMDLCREFDAVYLGSGKIALDIPGLNLNREGLIIVDPVTLATGLDGVFAGGGLLRGSGYSPIGSLSDGRRAAISIDRYLQQVSLTAARENEGPYRTRLFTGTKGAKPLPAVVPANLALGYTREEAIMEAGRCLVCQCLECVKACPYLDHFKAYPKKYVRQISHNLKMIMGLHEANTLINSCSLCGLCQEVCPESFNMADLCREARSEMFKKGKMPPSTHDFPIRDMDFSNSELCMLTRHQPGYESSSHIFFPGCQLSASKPDHVIKAYADLTERVTGGVGLMLRCCGAPAEWSGRTELFQTGLHEIKNQWQEMGRPGLILACSTCYQMFKKYLPEIDIVSLWELYDQIGLPEIAVSQKPGLVAVQDACTTRHEKHVHQSVRNILQKLGIEIEELPTSRETTECCGYGGLMSFANRKLADDTIRRRIDESPADYVAYCAMCRDNFAAKGKKTYHLLDLIYGEADMISAAKRGPGYSQRRENKARLKNTMLKEVWGDKLAVEQSSYEAINLIIPDEVSEIMEDRLILKEDVQKVIEHAEGTGQKLLNRNNGHVMACHRPVSVTYWVEYTRQEDGFVVHNVYSHRMKVEGNS